MESIKEVLKRRDGMSEEEAQDLIDEARSDLYERLSEGECPLEICREWFGLEEDYIMDLIYGTFTKAVKTATKMITSDIEEQMRIEQRLTSKEQIRNFEKEGLVYKTIMRRRNHEARSPKKEKKGS